MGWNTTSLVWLSRLLHPAPISPSLFFTTSFPTLHPRKPWVLVSVWCLWAFTPQLGIPFSPLFLVNPESFSTAQLNCHRLCEACSEFPQQQFSSMGPFFCFFDVDHFWSLYWICYDIASVVYVLVFWPQGMWGLTSPARDQTRTPESEEVLTTGPPGKS